MARGQRSNLNRIYRDRLWDEHGDEFSLVKDWVPPIEAESSVGGTASIGVVGEDGRLRWLQRAEHMSFWKEVRDRVILPGHEMDERVGRPYYRCRLWRRQQEEALTLEPLC